MTILNGNMYIAVCAAPSCGITWEVPELHWLQYLTANGCLLYFFGILFEALLGMDMDDVREKMQVMAMAMVPNLSIGK